MMARRSTIWIMCLVFAAAWCAWQIGGDRTQIDADFISLIGHENAANDPDMADINAVRHLLEQDSRQTIFMVSAPTRDQASSAAHDLAARLSWINGTEKVSTPDDRAGRLPELMALYGPHANSLLSPADRAALKDGKGEAIYKRALQNLYSPATTLSGQSLRQDPFSLLPGFLSSLGEKMGEGGHVIARNNRFYVPVIASLDPRLGSSQQDSRWVADATKAMADITGDDGNIHIDHTGQVFFSNAEATRAKDDVQRIAILATVGIVLMVGLVFFSWVPLLAALITVGSGILAGIAATTLIFDKVHAIALVFGTSLIGIAVDYALHYVAIDPERGTPEKRLRMILPGLTLGLMTSVTGFAALSISPTQLLTQIAVYSVAGLIAAYISVICLLPLLPPDPVRNFLPVRDGIAAIRRAHMAITPNLAGRRILVGLIVIGFALTPLLIRGQDDVRQLGHGNDALIAQTVKIRDILNLGSSPMFLKVTGETTQDRLETEEDLRKHLSPLLENGKLDGMLTLADVIPSKRRQAENRLLVASTLYSPFGDKLSAALPVSITSPDKDAPFLLPDQGSFRTLPELASLQASDHADIVRLRGVHDVAALKDAIAGFQTVHLIDPAATISDLFARYRHWAYLALGIAMVAALILSLIRYGLRDGICIFGAPAGAVLIALLGGHALGVPHNFFTTMALFLVFAIGADYVLFLAESRNSDHDADTSLAVLLSLISSVLAFGLLATSSVPLVSDIGTVIAIGLVAAWLLAPMMATPRKPASKSTPTPTPTPAKESSHDTL
jgi:predicted exporter